jgi:hypothetical protein
MEAFFQFMTDKIVWMADTVYMTFRILKRLSMYWGSKSYTAYQKSSSQ